MRKNGNTNKIDHDINIYNVLFLLHQSIKNRNQNLNDKCLDFIRSIDNVSCWLFVFFQVNNFDGDGCDENKQTLLSILFRLTSIVPHKVARMLNESKDDVFTNDVLTVLDNTDYKQRLIDLNVKKLNIIYISINVLLVILCVCHVVCFVSLFVWLLRIYI